MTSSIFSYSRRDFYGAGTNPSQFDDNESDAPCIRQFAGRLHEAIIQFHQAETPVLAGVDGVATGAEFNLTPFPDIVLFSDQAHLEYAYPRIGLTDETVRRSSCRVSSVSTR